MTDGLRKSHLRKAHQVGLSEVGLPDILWSVSKNTIRRLNSVQQKALRSVFLQPRRSHVSQNLSKFNILRVEQLITSIRAKFIHNLRIGKLPGEFKNFVTMVDFNDEDVRQSRFSPFNYHQMRDRTNPRYHIVKSWNNLPFLLKASQPDDFLEDLRDHFNKCNDQPCSTENCWLCDEK